MVRVTNTLL